MWCCPLDKLGSHIGGFGMLCPLLGWVPELGALWFPPCVPLAESLVTGVLTYLLLFKEKQIIESFLSFSKFFFFQGEKEEGGERGEQTSICCSTYSCTHWFFPACALTGDRTRNHGTLRWHFNQLSYSARAHSWILEVFILCSAADWEVNVLECLLISPMLLFLKMVIFLFSCTMLRTFEIPLWISCALLLKNTNAKLFSIAEGKVGLEESLKVIVSSFHITQNHSG